MLKLKATVVSVCLLIQQLFVMNASVSEISDEQLNRWLDNKPTITFIALTNHYPYSFIDDDGKVSGIIRDWTLDLEERFGIHARFISLILAVTQKLRYLMVEATYFPFNSLTPVTVDGF